MRSLPWQLHRNHRGAPIHWHYNHQAEWKKVSGDLRVMDLIAANTPKEFARARTSRRWTLGKLSPPTDYRIFVEAPETTDEPGPWPALVFMDGDDLFEFATAAYGELRASNAVPPLLLVGALRRQAHVVRQLDYSEQTSPRLYSDADEDGARERPRKRICCFSRGHTFAGARATLSRAKRRVRACGHSLGSLAVIHALFHAKPVFTRFLASAPSLWWDDRSPLKQIATRRKNSPGLSAKFYLSVGLDDTPEKTGDFTPLEQQLAANPFDGLELTIRRFPQRDHYGVIVDAFREGILTLFA